MKAAACQRDVIVLGKESTKTRKSLPSRWKFDVCFFFFKTGLVPVNMLVQSFISSKCLFLPSQSEKPDRFIVSVGAKSALF